MLYLTAKSYKATKGDEISVAIGTVVEVLQTSDNGWWLIRYSSEAKMAATGAKNGVLARTSHCSDLRHQPLHSASRCSLCLSFIGQVQQ